MKKHLLLTNDFPPKRGGIQNYLYELWSHLDPGSFSVLTTKTGADDRSFDLAQSFEIVRVRGPLLPTTHLQRTIRSHLRRTGAELVVIDPIFPLGTVATRLDLPYILLGHGAEITVPAVLAPLRRAMVKTIVGAKAVITSGPYPMRVVEDLVRRSGLVVPPVFSIAPSVDRNYFRPPTEEERSGARETLGLNESDTIVLFVSRLVPRKGGDQLIRALGQMPPSNRKVCAVFVGEGRDRRRLERLALRSGVDARFMGAVSRGTLRSLYHSADLFAMLCRDRWFGLEQEGFGIVFLEAGACGLATIAGRSGGSPDAVLDGRTGVVIQSPDRVAEVVLALERLVVDDRLRSEMGLSARQWVAEEFRIENAAMQLEGILERG
jgi:phosphatidylinositol alpha-1,6-mannosyltransferase